MIYTVLNTVHDIYPYLRLNSDFFSVSMQCIFFKYSYLSNDIPENYNFLDILDPLLVIGV